MTAARVRCAVEGVTTITTSTPSRAADMSEVTDLTGPKPDTAPPTLIPPCQRTPSSFSSVRL